MRGVAGRLAWAGTFHAVGARLLREYAAAIGLDPAFTILDRGDAADLLDLVRSELRPGARPTGASRRRAPASRSTRTPSTRRRRWTPCCRARFPGAPSGQTELKRLFAAYVEAKQRQDVLDYDDLLL